MRKKTMNPTQENVTGTCVWKIWLSTFNVHFSEMTWNEVGCNSQHDAHRHLPAVYTHFIHAKSQRYPCQGPYKADGSSCVAAAAHEKETGHPGVGLRKLASCRITHNASFSAWEPRTCADFT